TAGLTHPGVPPVYGRGRDAGERPYFALKLIDGRTLSELFGEREDRLHWLGVFEKISETVADAHARGVIHRDLEPLNVMVGACGEVGVMDWGLAKSLREPAQPLAAEGAGCGWAEGDGAQTATGQVLGTLAYMAPEQARGEPIDARADVFA